MMVPCQTNPVLSFHRSGSIVAAKEERNDYLAMDCTLADRFDLPTARLATTTERALYTIDGVTHLRLAADGSNFPEVQVASGFYI